MAISRAQLLKELLPGLNALYGLEYDKYENEHEEIYETETSDRSFEEEVKLSGFGAASDIRTAKDAIEAAKAADFAPDALTNLTTDQALQQAIANPSRFALGAD